MKSATVLAVGDHFVPASNYTTSLMNTLQDRVIVREVDLSGSKPDQARRQQLMEVDGANSVPIMEHLVDEMRRSDFVVVHFAQVPKEVFGDNSSVQAVFAARDGVQNIDVNAATNHNVGVFNVKGRNASGVAELALALMLVEARNIARADHSIKNGGWRNSYAHPPREVGDSTTGLVGFGHVGRELAQRLRGFETRILVSDPYVSADDVEAFGAELVSLEQLFSQADFVSVQAKLTVETTKMVNASLFNLMKPTAYIVNVGRSRLVDTRDLLDALENDRIAGAGLDVFDEEPLSTTSPFRSLDNVTLTPHFGGDTLTTNTKSADLVADAIANFLEGRSMSTAVNAPDLGWIE